MSRADEVLALYVEHRLENSAHWYRARARSRMVRMRVLATVVAVTFLLSGAIGVVLPILSTFSLGRWLPVVFAASAVLAGALLVGPLSRHLEDDVGAATALLLMRDAARKLQMEDRVSEHHVADVVEQGERFIMTRRAPVDFARSTRMIDAPRASRH
jgi:SMODS and SLOG-associating 2TM effector domain 1